VRFHVDYRVVWATVAQRISGMGMFEERFGSEPTSVLDNLKSGVHRPVEQMLSQDRADGDRLNF
jgi:hypothetical protein